MAALPQVSLPVAVPVAVGSVEAVHSTVLLAGQLMVGAVVSTTVMVWSQVLLLPQSSVAFQCRVMVLVLPQPVTSVSVWLMAALPQVSLPVAVPVAVGSVEAVHSTVLLAGQLMVGAVVSTTVMVWSQVLLLSQASVAFQCRVMVLVLPQPVTSVSVWLMAALPQVSLPVAVPVAVGSVEAVHSTVLLAGQLMVGAVVSTTVMVWSQVLLLSQASVAFQCRVMVLVLPQPVTSVSVWLMAALPQVSLPVAVPVAVGSVEAVHSTVLFAGQLVVGAVISTTGMVWSQVLLLPQASVAFQCRVMVFVLPQPVTSVSVWLMAALPQVSLPVAEPWAAALVSPVHSTVLLAGQLMVGAVVSTTVMVWSQVLLLPQASVAFQCRVMVLVLPQPVTSVSVWPYAALFRSSLPVAVPVAVGSVEAVHSTV